ncbi:MAG: DUF2089 family protein [Planctomycetota bacterium]
MLRSCECPYCSLPMRPSRMTCDACGVGIDGDFPLARTGLLPEEHQRFIEMFVLAGGNLKVIAEQTGVSYPTVRSRLDKVIALLRDEIAKTTPVNGTVLDAVHADAKADDAARLIKKI